MTTANETATTLDQNKAFVRRWYDALSRDDPPFEAFLTPDSVDHGAGPDQPPGLEGTRQNLLALRRGFPDLTLTVRDQLAEGDRVSNRLWVSGTHLGPFQGLPPTARTIGFEAIDIVRIQDGRIVERWGVTDALGLLTQLGALPSRP